MSQQSNYNLKATDNFIITSVPVSEGRGTEFLRLNTAFRRDPTRTTQLRNGFASAAARRFRELRSAIRVSIVDNDCFGLRENQPLARLRIQTSKPVPAKPGQFAFPRTSTKIEKFMEWLNVQEEKGILEITRRPGALRGMEQAWTDVWIHSAYQKGIARARQELRKEDSSIPALTSDDRLAVSAVMNQPIHADRVGALYTRTFNELKGIDQAMDQQISRLLSQGLMEGKNPLVIARSLGDVFEINNTGAAVGMRAITRAKVMARTEIIRAHHVANINEFRQWGVEGVEVKAEWLTAGFNVCPICSALEGQIFTLDEIEGKIPLHPNCLVDGQVTIYTSVGWQAIKNIKVDDLVLTHKGRFKKVIQIHRNTDRPIIVRMFLAGKNNQQMSLSVTNLHPVYVNKKWISAKDIKQGDPVSFLADKCKRCGKKIPYFKKYCSQTCLSLDITDKQWKDPEHRKNMSQKATAQLKREYLLGLRDGDKIIEAAHKVTRRMAKDGRCPLVREDVRDKIRLVTNTPEMRIESSNRMKENNPMHNAEVRDKFKESLKNLYELHPEKRLNARMAKHRKSGKMTWIEKRMGFLLDKIGVKYVFQYPILRYNVDFAIPDLRIVIECDGEYWHQDKQADLIRQRKIEKEGWSVLRYTGKKINQCLDEIEEELARVFGNHNGDFEFISLPVKGLKSWQSPKQINLYNLSVENDESYIANGFIVHNCRCVAIPVRAKVT